MPFEQFRTVQTRAKEKNNESGNTDVFDMILEILHRAEKFNPEGRHNHKKARLFLIKIPVAQNKSQHDEK